MRKADSWLCSDARLDLSIERDYAQVDLETMISSAGVLVGCATKEPLTERLVVPQHWFLVNPYHAPHHTTNMALGPIRVILPPKLRSDLRRRSNTDGMCFIVQAFYL